MTPPPQQPQQQPRKQGGGNRRRKGGGGQKPRPTDLWAPVPALPDPSPIVPTTDPRVLLRSLGDPPLAGQGAVAEHYLGAVVDRAAALATALAAAAGLLVSRRRRPARRGVQDCPLLGAHREYVADGPEGRGRQREAMMKSGRRFLALLAVVGLVAAGCGDDDDGGSEDASDTTTTVADDGSGSDEPITIGIDGTSDDVNMFALRYFPDKVQAHAGDTLVYESRFTGEPHSITFGASIDEAIKLFQSVPPEVANSDGPPPAEYEDEFNRVNEIFSSLPAMLPEGPGDANQISVNPCFIATGDIPTDATQACEVQEPEPFTGTETFYNSGFLPDGESFEMQLADDIEPGTYIGFCILHFTAMTSEIEVVGDDVEIPDAAAVAEEGQAQLDELAAAVAAAAEAAAAEAEPGTASAGVGGPDVGPAVATVFAPGDVAIAAGESVTWNVVGPHTISFNAPESARTIIIQDENGQYHLSEEALAPAGFEPPPPPEGEPEGPPPTVDGGTFDGTGFRSSGILFDQPFMLAFSTAGTYEYVCTIHPEMEGTVTVS